jgi:hypothetical protein
VRALSLPHGDWQWPIGRKKGILNFSVLLTEEESARALAWSTRPRGKKRGQRPTPWLGPLPPREGPPITPGDWQKSGILDFSVLRTEEESAVALAESTAPPRRRRRSAGRAPLQADAEDAAAQQTAAAANR